MYDNASPFTFRTPPKIHIEWNGLSRFLTEEALLWGRRPLLVTGSSLRAAGILEALLSGLTKAGLTVSVHENVLPEPDLVALESCRAALLAHRADMVIAVGGGSVLDVGKAAAGLALTTIPAREYFAGTIAVPETGLPIIAIPTTAGTGSEVTWVSVLSDMTVGSPRKASIRGGALMPKAVLLDASLTASCPSLVTATSGMDAFVQAVEAYTSVGANPLTDALAIQAVHLTRPERLLQAIAEPQNRAARESLALGSLMAGMALNTSRLGLVHGFAHPVGALSKRAHGAVCALLLAPVMRFNQSACLEKYRHIAQIALPNVKFDESNETTASRLIDYLEATVREKLHLPARLGEIGITEADFYKIVGDAIQSGSTKANPRLVSSENAVAVLRSCL